MFKWVFYYWYNNIDTPYINYKFNLWFYVNIRQFKFKISNYLTFFISSLNNLTFKTLKIFYKDIDFIFFYIKITQISFLLIIFIFLFFLL
uniref:ymf70 n=1 Tax=Cryptocaryon irritans TaxID=153251 RepID=UPI0022FD3C34|nr:ymf70 [Cryptocaryon irritans]WBP62309.1 ymf70 [Cryptocaryon irritans]